MYSASSARPFDDVVRAVEENAVRLGLRVLAVHDLAAALRDKGFDHGPIRVVEVFDARQASRLLAVEGAAAVLLPCKVVVYASAGQTRLIAPLASARVGAAPQARAIAREVDDVLRRVVDTSA